MRSVSLAQQWAFNPEAKVDCDTISPDSAESDRRNRDKRLSRGDKPGHRDKVFLPVSFEPELYDHLTKICPKLRWREEVRTELRGKLQDKNRAGEGAQESLPSRHKAL